MWITPDLNQCLMIKLEIFQILLSVSFRKIGLIVGCIILFILVTYHLGKWLWRIVEIRWPIKYPCSTFEDLQAHIEQHYKRGADRCIMHLETTMRNLNLALFKYWVNADSHIFYFIIFKDITPSHSQYKDYINFIKKKGFAPETGINVRKLKCEKEWIRSDEVIYNLDSDFRNNLTCELDSVKATMYLIREMVGEYGDLSNDLMFMVRVTGVMDIGDIFISGDMGFKPLLNDIKGLRGKPYQRWHEMHSLWYWGFVFVREIAFGRKEVDSFTPVTFSNESKKTPGDDADKSHENTANDD